jgi:DNA-binding response OmpR family regulator
VMMLTGRDAPAEQVQGLETGADDYMLKPFSFEVLLAHIHALLRRHEADQPQILHYADLTLEPARHAVLRGERPVTLTSLEFRLLHAFLRHPEQVLPKELLLDRVWGYDFGGNANIVEVYVKLLRQKLESGGESRLLHTIRGAGYVLRQGE